MNGLLVDVDMDWVEWMIVFNVVVLICLVVGVVEGFCWCGGGVIVNFGLVVVLVLELFNVVYSVIKVYVLSLSQLLQYELVGSGVYVQVVLFGVICIEIWECSGIGIVGIFVEMVMEVEDLVEVVLVGFDWCEVVIILLLLDVVDWQVLMMVWVRFVFNLLWQWLVECYFG